MNVTHPPQGGQKSPDPPTSEDVIGLTGVSSIESWFPRHHWPPPRRTWTTEAAAGSRRIELGGASRPPRRRAALRTTSASAVQSRSGACAPTPPGPGFQLRPGDCHVGRRGRGERFFAPTLGGTFGVGTSVDAVVARTLGRVFFALTDVGAFVGTSDVPGVADTGSSTIPYYTVHMVGHDYEFIQSHTRIMVRNG